MEFDYLKALDQKDFDEERDARRFGSDDYDLFSNNPVTLEGDDGY